tara:strand:+ start:62 stop:355 length:294 start_codon:yes stop_codon:yes gene_type:complete
MANKFIRNISEVEPWTVLTQFNSGIPSKNYIVKDEPTDKLVAIELTPPNQSPVFTVMAIEQRHLSGPESSDHLRFSKRDRNDFRGYTFKSNGVRYGL